MESWNKSPGLQFIPAAYSLSNLGHVSSLSLSFPTCKMGTQAPPS